MSNDHLKSVDPKTGKLYGGPVAKRKHKCPTPAFWRFANRFAKREKWFIGGFLGALQEAWGKK
jgi:hypothetical protein